MIAKAVGFSEYIAASVSSVQTKEFENGNDQISRGKFDPVQYCAYFGERKYFESTQWQPYDKSYCDAKLPLHRKNSSKTNLIAFPCYNHVTTADTLIGEARGSSPLLAFCQRITNSSSPLVDLAVLRYP